MRTTAKPRRRIGFRYKRKRRRFWRLLKKRWNWFMRQRTIPYEKLLEVAELLELEILENAKQDRK